MHCALVTFAHSVEEVGREQGRGGGGVLAKPVQASCPGDARTHDERFVVTGRTFPVCLDAARACVKVLLWLRGL